MSIFEELRRRHVIKVVIAYSIVAWLLVQVASVFVPALQLPEWVLSLVALFLILGFPVAVFLAWAYELTPDGMRPTGSAVLPESVRKVAGRRLDFTIIGLLSATLAFVAVDQYILEERGRADVGAVEAGVPSVAVLPFVSMSGDPEQEYFSDGISEELLNVLGRIPELRVPSRTSAFSFKGMNTPLQTIAEELSVDHILEGSVRKEGDQVRVVAQLIEVETNRSLWSETFDRKLTSVFDIQDEIAARVAEVLQIRFLRSQDRSMSQTTNVVAHDEYLRGLAYISTQASSDVLEAIKRFETAIQHDPQYAAAYGMLASAYNVTRQFDYLPPDVAAAGASAAVNRALELDPLLARAYYERSHLTDDPASRIADLQRATELGLNDSTAHLSRSQVLLRLGRHADARKALEAAVGIDPRSVQLNWMMGALRLNLGDRNGARGYYRRTIDLQPTSPNAYAGMGDVETVEGRLDEAVRWYVAGLEQDPGQPHMTSWVGYLYLSLGDVERAAVWFERGASLLHGSGPTHEIIAEFVPLVFHNSDAGRLIELVGGASPGLFGPFGSRMFRKAVLTTGKATEIRSYYEELWPELFNENPEIGPFNFDVVPEVVWMIQSETERDHTDAMLEEALAVFRDNQWASMYPSDLATSLPEVEILGLLGREDEALNALHEQIAKGWRFGWWQVSRDPVLESIRDRPGFTDMLEDVRADMASQLAAMPDYDPPPSSE